MKYFVFRVCMSSDAERYYIASEWPTLVARAKPENVITSDSAYNAMLRFAERANHEGDYVAGTENGIECAARVAVKMVPRARVVCHMDMPSA